MYRKDHIPELDGLRGIAVLLVLWVHLPPAALGATVRAINHHVIPGNVGVDLFFVLSGFLITRILLVDRERGVPLRHFLMRRFLRIFPIYYLLLALLAPWMQAPEIAACASYTSNYAFLFMGTTSMLEHSWSLAIEEHFYLVWPPLAVFLAPTISRRVLLFGILPLSMVTGLAALVFGDWSANAAFWTEFLNRGSTSRFGSLGMGALLAYHEGFVRRSGWRPLVVIAGLGLVSFLVSEHGAALCGLREALLQVPSVEGRFANALPTLRLIGVPSMSLAVLMLGVTHTGRALPWAAVMRNRVLAGIGRISYGLYLYHFPIFRFVFERSDDVQDPGAWYVVLAIAVSFAAAGVSYWVIERPIMRYAKRWRR